MHVCSKTEKQTHKMLSHKHTRRFKTKEIKYIHKSRTYTPTTADIIQANSVQLFSGKISYNTNSHQSAIFIVSTATTKLT